MGINSSKLINFNAKNVQETLLILDLALSSYKQPGPRKRNDVSLTQERIIEIVQYFKQNAELQKPVEKFEKALQEFTKESYLGAYETRYNEVIKSYNLLKRKCNKVTKTSKALGFKNITTRRFATA